MGLDWKLKKHTAINVISLSNNYNTLSMLRYSIVSCIDFVYFYNIS